MLFTFFTNHSNYEILDLYIYKKNYFLLSLFLLNWKSIQKKKKLLYIKGLNEIKYIKNISNFYVNIANQKNNNTVYNEWKIYKNELVYNKLFQIDQCNFAPFEKYFLMDFQFILFLIINKIRFLLKKTPSLVKYS